jgi:GNAT superfamily N-acetyltransferase
MTARRARPEEWERVKELRLRALREEPTFFRARYEDEVAEPDEEWQAWVEKDPVFVAGECEAICAAYLRDDGDAQLIAMYVPPETRGRGYGRALVDAVETWARDEGHARVRLNVLETNEAARTLYESCGYVMTGRLEDDPNALVLAKTL